MLALSEVKITKCKFSFIINYYLALTMALIDEYRYDQKDVRVRLTVRCSDGRSFTKDDKMEMKGRRFTNFHVDPKQTHSLTSGQCTPQSSQCLRNVVRMGDYLTDLPGIYRKFDLCYGEKGKSLRSLPFT